MIARKAETSYIKIGRMFDEIKYIIKPTTFSLTFYMEIKIVLLETLHK